MKGRLAWAAALAASLVCMVVHPGVAAESGEPSVSIEQLRTRLGLTEEQQAQIAPLVDERREKLEPIRAQMASASTRREKFALLKQAKSVQDDFVAKVQPVLTKDQQAEWDRMRAEMREQLKQRWRDR